MKIINAMPSMAGMTKVEVDSFLESRLNVQLATIDEMGDPNIQPVWFYYDKNAEDLYVMTPKMSKKVQNIRSKPTVYFSIDDENYPYKGVKGKGTVTLVEDPKKVVPLVEELNLKYLGTLDHPIAKMLVENARNGIEILLKIKPRFFSTWDFGKMQ
jgi:PPOX class probable F420-dependent enzyme